MLALHPIRRHEPRWQCSFGATCPNGPRGWGRSMPDNGCSAFEREVGADDEPYRSPMPTLGVAKGLSLTHFSLFIASEPLDPSRVCPMQLNEPAAEHSSQ